MQKRLMKLLLLVPAILLALPALAWGPKAQLAIVTTSVNLLSKSSNIPLNRLQSDLPLTPDVVSGAVTSATPALTAATANDDYSRFSPTGIAVLTATFRMALSSSPGSN